MTGSKSGRRARPERAFQNNNGLYNPNCDENRLFKAKQYNSTTMCWNVNTAEVRRNDKDIKIFHSELVRIQNVSKIFCVRMMLSLLI